MPLFALAQKDTVRVMGYNVLYYGNGCQGPNGLYHGYFSTIVKWANPDIISLVKAGSAPTSPEEKQISAPLGFPDSIVRYALDVAFPGRYAYCTYTNASKSTNMVLLIYDKTKFGFAGLVSSYSNITDFNTYKLFYREPGLAQGQDTTFLYLTLNHDKSGDDNEPVRAQQLGAEMAEIHKHFTRLPNYINMGDFNVRSSSEGFYKMFTSPEDEGFKLYDPPFFPDRKLKYPADWDHNPSFAAYFTTSTRELESVPNSCGTGGGAKGWYDHIFLSENIVKNADHIRYIPNSYTTLGNDGNRYRIGINNGSVSKNKSAPAEVIEAMYRMSNKYPVMVSLEVTKNKGEKTVHSERFGVPVFKKEMVTLETATVEDQVTLIFPEAMLHEELTLEYVGKDGLAVFSKAIRPEKTKMNVKCKLDAGQYSVRISGEHNVVSEIPFTKK